MLDQVRRGRQGDGQGKIHDRRGVLLGQRGLDDFLIPTLEGQRPLVELLERADPQAAWLKRVNWLLDLIDWLHYEPAGMRSDEKVRHAIKTRRLKLLLNQIDRHPAQYAAVAATVQSVLKDADGLEFFSATGLLSLLAAPIGSMLPSSAARASVVGRPCCLSSKAACMRPTC